MLKRSIIMLVVSTLIFGTIFGYHFMGQYFMEQYFKTFVPPAVSIKVEKPEQRVWQPLLKTTGTLSVSQSTQIVSQVPGIIETIAIKSGQSVAKDQDLFQLDDKQERADLESIEATYNLNKVNFERDKELYAKNLEAKVDYESSKAQYAQSKAALEQAKIAIEKKNITAPFAGKLGIRQVSIGDYVTPGQMLISLDDLSHIDVLFDIAQNDYSKVYLNQELFITVDSYPDKKFYGKVYAIDSSAKDKTHSITIKAAIEDKNQELIPGLFVNINLLLKGAKDMLWLPETAVDYNLYGQTIYVYQPYASDDKEKKHNGDGKVVSVFVETGDRKDGSVVITKGIKKDDYVVTQGQNRLSNHMAVKLKK